MTGLHVHVVGAGLAGLAAALAASAGGARVSLFDAAPQAGGRCRSFHDPVLDRVIDTGSHLLLGINRVALDYAHAIGGTAHMRSLAPRIHFHHVVQRRDWTASPVRPPVGWREILRAAWPLIPTTASVAQWLGRCPGYGEFWMPLCLAVLNTAPEHADARLLARVLRAILAGGRAGFRGFLFPRGLSAALIDPALETLRRRDVKIRFGRRLRRISQHKLTFADASHDLSAADRVILAVPPWALAEFFPDIRSFATESITNVHFRLPRAQGPDHPVGLVGGVGHWLFRRDDVASVTLSACGLPPDPVQLWTEIAPILGLDGPMPVHRVITEKRATLTHAPGLGPLRPPSTTQNKGMFLAGDWLASPWPCTMESAISSGLRAARLALGRDDLRFS